MIYSKDTLKDLTGKCFIDNKGNIDKVLFIQHKSVYYISYALDYSILHCSTYLYTMYLNNGIIRPYEEIK